MVQAQLFALFCVKRIERNVRDIVKTNHAFAVAFAVVGAMSHWLDYSLLDPRVLLGTLICLIAGGALIWLACGRLVPDDSRMGLMLVGSLIVGVATPLYYMEMVRQLLPTAARNRAISSGSLIWTKRISALFP